MADAPLACPQCGTGNPVGFVWCRACKASLTKPERRRIPSLPLLLASGLALILLLAIFTSGDEEVPSPREPSLGEGPAAERPEVVQERLEDWWKRASGEKRADDGGAP